MSTTGLFVFLGVGRILIFLFQKAPYQKIFKKWPIVTELFECPLCLGVWFYSILSAIFRVFLFTDFLPYVHVLTELITGSVMSMIMWLVSMGWEAKFKVYYLED